MKKRIQEILEFFTENFNDYTDITVFILAFCWVMLIVNEVNANIFGIFFHLTVILIIVCYIAIKEKIQKNIKEINEYNDEEKTKANFVKTEYILKNNLYNKN